MTIQALCACVALAGTAGLSAAAAGFPVVEREKPSVSLVKTGDKQVDADIDFFSNAVWRCTGDGTSRAGSDATSRIPRSTTAG